MKTYNLQSSYTKCKILHAVVAAAVYWWGSFNDFRVTSEIIIKQFEHPVKKKLVNQIFAKNNFSNGRIFLISHSIFHVTFFLKKGEQQRSQIKKCWAQWKCVGCRFLFNSLLFLTPNLLDLFLMKLKRYVLHYLKISSACAPYIYYYFEIVNGFIILYYSLLYV